LERFIQRFKCGTNSRLCNIFLKNKTVSETNIMQIPKHVKSIFLSKLALLTTN